MKLTGLLLRTGFIISLFPGSGGGYYQVLMSVPRAKVYRLYSVVFCKQCLSHLASFSTSGKTEGSFFFFFLPFSHFYELHYKSKANPFKLQFALTESC